MSGQTGAPPVFSITIGESDEARVAQMQEHLSVIPHADAIGLRVNAAGTETAEVTLPYSDELVGDPDTGVLFGGAITALLDNAAGFVARPNGAEWDELAIATLDLRIDYMGPAAPGCDVTARAFCYHRTSKVAFVRAEAFTRNPDAMVATCTGVFMIGTPNGPRSNGGDR